MDTHVWTRGLARRKRALYLSSPIGLGHARRDVAIAKELMHLVPDLEIDWLAQHPVTMVLESEGERIHPASEYLANESAHIASEATGHDLHCFQALRSMDEILVANFMLFQEVVEEGLYDLVIGDEAWDVDHFWHENPELKRGSHVWMTDFVGFLPMPDGGEREAFLTADYNAEMIEHVERFPRIRDQAVYVGNPDDIVPEVFGPGAAQDPRLDRSALRVLRIHHRVHPTRCRPACRVAVRAGLWGGRTGVRGGGGRVGGGPSAAGEGDRRLPRRQGTSFQRCGWWLWPGRISPRKVSRVGMGSRCTATWIVSTGTSRYATWRWCREG